MNAYWTSKKLRMFQTALTTAACFGLTLQAMADTDSNICQSTMETSEDHPTLMDFSSAEDVEQFNEMFPQVAITETHNKDVVFEDNTGITSKSKDKLTSENIVFKNGGRASVTFLTEGAGYNHLFGYFRVQDIAHYFEYEKDADGNIISERLRDCDENGIPDFHEDLFFMRSKSYPRADVEACRYIDKAVCDASQDKSIRACETFRYFKGNGEASSLPTADLKTIYTENAGLHRGDPPEMIVDFGQFYDIGRAANDGGRFPRVPNILEPPSAENNYAGVGRIIYSQSDYKGNGSNQGQVTTRRFWESPMPDSYKYELDSSTPNYHMNWDMVNMCLDGQKKGNNNSEWCTVRQLVPATASTHKSVRVELKETFNPGDEVVFFLIVATGNSDNHVCLAPNWKTGKCDFTKPKEYFPVFSKAILNATSTKNHNAAWQNGYKTLMTNGKTIIIDQYRTTNPTATTLKTPWLDKAYVDAADVFVPDLHFTENIKNTGTSSSHIKASGDALSRKTTKGAKDNFPRFPHAFAANFSWSPYFWILGFEDQTIDGNGDWDYEDVAFIIETDAGGSVRSDVITGDASGAAVSSAAAVCTGKDCDNFSITNVLLKIKDQPHRTRTSAGMYTSTSESCADSTIYYDLATDCETWNETTRSYVINNNPSWRRIQDEDCATDTHDPDYKLCKVNMSLEGYTGSRLCWRAQFISLDEGKCLPLLQAMDIRYDMMRPGSYSRSSPTSLASSIFYGSWELITPTKKTCELGEQLLDLNSSTCFPPSKHYQTQTLDYTARGHFVFRDLYKFSSSGKTLVCQEECSDSSKCLSKSNCWNWNAGQILATKGIVPGSGSATSPSRPNTGIGTISNPTRALFTTNAAGSLMRLLPLENQLANDYAGAYEEMMSLAVKTDGTYDSEYNFDGDAVVSPYTDGVFLTYWLHGWETPGEVTSSGSGSGSGSGGGTGAGSSGICEWYSVVDERISCCDACCASTAADSGSHKILNCDNSCLETCKNSCCKLSTTGSNSGFVCSRSGAQCTPIEKMCQFTEGICSKSRKCNKSNKICNSNRDCGPTEGNCTEEKYRCSNNLSKICDPNPKYCSLNETCTAGSTSTDYYNCDIDSSCLPNSSGSGSSMYSSESQQIRAWPMGAFEFSTPAIVGPPTLNPKLPVLERANYTTNYQNYLYNAKKDRPTVAYVGASDGMLHAFDAGIFRYDKKLHDNDLAQKGAFKNFEGTETKGTGEEIFSFIPRKQLKRLINNYTSQSPAALAESSPTVADIDLGYNKTWKPATESEPNGAMTALTMAAGKNSPVIFALDVTNVHYDADISERGMPRVLWELDMENDQIITLENTRMTLPEYVKKVRRSDFVSSVVRDPALDTTASRHSPTLVRMNFVDGATDMSSSDNVRWVAIYSSDYGDGDKIGAVHIIDMLTGLPVFTSQSSGLVTSDVLVDGSVDVARKNLAGVFLLKSGEGVSGEIPSVDINEDGIGDILYVPTTQGRIYKISTEKNQICILADLHKDLKNYAENVKTFTALDGRGTKLSYGTELKPEHFKYQNLFSSIAVSLDNSYRVKIYAATGNNPDDAGDPADSVSDIYFWLAGITDSFPKNAEPDEKGMCVSGYSAFTATPLVQGQSVWGGVAVSATGMVAVTSAAGTAADACHLRMGEGSGYLYQFNDPANLQNAGESLTGGGSGGTSGGEGSAAVTSTAVRDTDAPIISAPIFVNNQVVAISAAAKLETLGDGNYNQAAQFDSIINMLNWQRVTNGKLVP